MSFGNYLVDKSRKIGSGATASVYIGIDKNDAKLYAIKLSSISLVKESVNNKDIKHCNIVSFFGYYVENHEYALVMEYCNKGSLNDFILLQDGLCDNMLIKTLECLCYGMEYLRSKNLLHRDIKPANIMIHMDFDGEYFVKLGDLGVSKKVSEDENFSTFCGTPVFLSPELFNHYVMGSGDKAFKPNVDLWAMGVTIYYAIMVQVPFQSYNGTFQSAFHQYIVKMYNDRPDGIVSGRQKCENTNEVEWSYELPKNRGISPMLSDAVSKIVALLLNRNVSYENFFNETKKILQKKRVLIFSANDGVLQYLYLDNLAFDTIMAEVSKMQGLEPDNIILLTKSHQLSGGNSEVLRDTPVKGHLHYECTDDIVYVVPIPMQANQKTANNLGYMRKVPLKILDPPSKNPSQDEFNAYDEYAKIVMKYIYQIYHEFCYLKCQSACYKNATKTLMEQYIDKKMEQMQLLLPLNVEFNETQCELCDRIIQTSMKIGKHAEIENFTENMQKFKNYIDKIRRNTAIVKQELDDVRNNLCDVVEQDINEIRQLEQNDMTRLVHEAEEVLSSLKILSQSENNKYDVQIWSRNMALNKYHEIATMRIKKQRTMVNELHKKYTSSWLCQIESQLNKLSRFKKWCKERGDRQSVFFKIFEYHDSLISRMQRGYKTQGNFDATSYQILNKIKKEVEILKNSHQL